MTEEHKSTEGKEPSQQSNNQQPDNCEAKAQAETQAREPKPITVMDIELEALRRENTENKDKYLRLLAEMENTRKRLQKERQEHIQYALQNVIADFLNPIDHMENALGYTDNMPDQVKNWAVGFKMILEQFKDVLTTNGVQPFKSVGAHFDPHSHEAVEMVETDKQEPGTIVEESIKGYKMGDRVIRPARVKVAKAPATPLSPEPQA